MTVHDGNEVFGPPFATELLADLHAGVLPDEVSERLWPLVRQDPAALAVIDALDAVSARLGAAGRDHTVGTPIPPDVAARINTALGLDDSQSSASVTALSGTRGRRRTRAWIAVAVAGAAAAVGAVFTLTGVDGGHPTAPAVIASSTPEPPQTTIADLGSELDGTQVLTLLRDAAPSGGLGRLADPQVRAGCLQANGIDSTVPVLGTRQVRFRGNAAVLLLVTGPNPPTLTALVVGTGCAADHPDLLTRTEIG